jgi:hypothetical protein
VPSSIGGVVAPCGGDEVPSVIVGGVRIIPRDWKCLPLLWVWCWYYYFSRVEVLSTLMLMLSSSFLEIGSAFYYYDW